LAFQYYAIVISLSLCYIATNLSHFNTAEKIKNKKKTLVQKYDDEKIQQLYFTVLFM